MVGFVGGDPDRKTTRSGVNWTRFSLATSERWRDKRSGDQKERTEWHNVVSFDDKIVAFIEEYVRKGMRVYVEGKQRTRKWKEDEKWFQATDTVLEPFGCRIELLDKKGGGQRDIDEDSYSETRTSSSGDSSSGGNFMRDDDDIPFAPEWRG